MRTFVFLSACTNPVADDARPPGGDSAVSDTAADTGTCDTPDGVLPESLWNSVEPWLLVYADGSAYFHDCTAAADIARADVDDGNVVWSVTWEQAGGGETWYLGPGVVTGTFTCDQATIDLGERNGEYIFERVDLDTELARCD